MKDELAIKLYTNIISADEPRVFEAWHASSLAECPKAHYLKRLGVERVNRPGAGKMLRWKAGHLIEEVIRPFLEVEFDDLKSNVRLNNKELDLTGEYDNYSEKRGMIIEVKSVHDRAFKYKKVGEDRFNLIDSKPYLNHELQNHAYALMLQEEGKPVNGITYVYITLDGRIATYSTKVNDNILAEVKKRLSILNDAWESKIAPKCICQDKNHPLYKSTMQYCDYKDGDKCCEEKLKEK